MTTQMQDQIKDFEIFVERMEAFVEEIKSDETLKKANFKLEDMDLRTKDGEIFPVPTKLEDYFDLWVDVKKCADDYYSEKDLEKRELWGMNEYFFDLYWNDVEGNSAYYQDMAFWVYFDDTKGIVYTDPLEEEEEIVPSPHRIIDTQFGECMLKNEETDEQGYPSCELYIGDNFDSYIGTCSCSLNDSEEVILEQIDELLNY